MTTGMALGMTGRAARRRFTPDPTALYMGDNGMVLCGAHLGATATYSGRDLSGRKVVKVTPAMVAAEGLALSDWRCENPRCGRGLVAPDAR